jgi:hypothetical protein
MYPCQQARAPTKAQHHVTKLRSACTQPSKDHLHTQVRIFTTKNEGKSTNSQEIKVSIDPYLKDSQELRSG